MDEVIATSLQIDVAHVHDGLAYQDIAEWDSMGHISLMLALEREYGIALDEPHITALVTVGHIRACVAARGNGVTSGDVHEAAPERQARVHRGLVGVAFDRSSITSVDGRRGRLLYRGYAADALAHAATFEDTVHLLLMGELPTAAQRTRFAASLRRARPLPRPVLRLIEQLRHVPPIVALRTVVSVLEAHAPPDATAAAVALIAQVPTAIAAHHALRQGRRPTPPAAELPHAANYLYMLTDVEPDPEEARLLEGDLVIHADHDANASAFTARVATSTQAGLHAAITAAIATFAGPLHGGALTGAAQMLDAIGTVERVGPLIRERLARRLPIFGFGHRVYRTVDPRAAYLRTMAERLSARHQDAHYMTLLAAIVAEMRPFSERGVHINVDFYACVAYRLLGLPDDLAVPTFVAGRVAGWCAQVAEQRANNVLIRPCTRYVGPAARPLPYAADPAQARAAQERAAC